MNSLLPGTSPRGTMRDISPALQTGFIEIQTHFFLIIIINDKTHNDAPQGQYTSARGSAPGIVLVGATHRVKRNGVIAPGNYVGHRPGVWDISP